MKMLPAILLKPLNLGDVMKKFVTNICCALLSLMVGACAVSKEPVVEYVPAQSKPVLSSSAKKVKPITSSTISAENVEVIPYVKGYKAAFKKKSYPDKATEEEMMYKQYGDVYSRLIENVNVYDQNPKQVTYQYNDARVDELALLAIEYCKNQNNKQAVLQKIKLFRNKARLATFDCVRL